MNCERNNLSAIFPEDGTFDDSALSLSFEELSQELDFHQINPKNIVLVWNLPPVLNLDLLRVEFLAQCVQKVPGLSIMSSKIEHRTDQKEKLANYNDPRGNPNVLLCSYILIAVREREHLWELIRVWDKQVFQTKKLRVQLSKFDGGDDQ
ncbi:hypothetical protein niasHT_039829 [Heterodera trifolii]|uniref:Uncharacterized protein n=1 Tax=Heterodera trifolii TaxID=157864 RepID=A0ABD2IMQ6_9BILA